ncbi:MAG: glycosyltransferase [Lachnospiraceae bacterium]
MKVLQINSVCGVGSTGRIATDIYSVLKEQGHECKIAYGRDKAQHILEEDTIKIGTDFDLKTHALKTRITDKTGFYSKKATKKFLEEVRRYNPDIIHLHNIHGYYLNIELLFKYLANANKPVVWTLHDCWAFTGHCSHFDYVGCDKWKKNCCNCPQKNEYPKSICLDNSSWNYQNKKRVFTSVKNLTIITPSKWLANLVKDSFLNQYEVEVINNGIDINVFKPIKNNYRIENNLLDKKIVLGVASTWNERKGFKDFIELSKILDINFQIILVGLSKKQLESLPLNIIGIKRTNNVKELAELYSMADVFVNPTYEDNFPTTNLEAMACGTPVITYNTGGSPESLLSDSGSVIEKGDIFELKKCIENKTDNREFMSATLFDKEITYKRYQELYETHISKKQILKADKKELL